jgi:hypothetical protein
MNMNYYQTLISVADDSPVTESVVPVNGFSSFQRDIRSMCEDCHFIQDNLTLQL